MLCAVAGAVVLFCFFFHTPQDSLTNDTTTSVLFRSTSAVGNISPFCYSLALSAKQRVKLKAGLRVECLLLLLLLLLFLFLLFLSGVVGPF
jgi:hypothetical protein